MSVVSEGSKVVLSNCSLACVGATRCCAVQHLISCDCFWSAPSVRGASEVWRHHAKEQMLKFILDVQTECKKLGLCERRQGAREVRNIKWMAMKLYTSNKLCRVRVFCTSHVWWGMTDGSVHSKIGQRLCDWFS
jgi:hypothetical protein